MLRSSLRKAPDSYRRMEFLLLLQVPKLVSGTLSPEKLRPEGLGEENPNSPNLVLEFGVRTQRVKPEISELGPLPLA